MHYQPSQEINLKKINNSNLFDGFSKQSSY